MSDMEKLKDIVFQFVDKDDNVKVEPLGKGHINDSYRVGTDDKEYVLQRINHNIFKNVHELQNNIHRVTSHIRAKLIDKGVADVERRVITLMPTHEGALYHKDNNGDYWRLMVFIKDSKSYEEINPDLAYRAGMAFGEFQKLLRIFRESHFLKLSLIFIIWRIGWKHLERRLKQTVRESLMRLQIW